MDAVERGETIVVMCNGTPIAEPHPSRRRTFVPTAELKRTLEQVPRTDYKAMRAAMDAMFGEDRLDG